MLRLGLMRSVAVPSAPVVLAILPVDNPSGDPRAEYLGAGITSVVAGNFGSIPGLTVLSRVSTASYEKNRGDLVALQRELGATFVLDLSLRIVAQTPHLVARLYRPGEARPVWDDTIQGDALAIEKTVLDGLGRTLERSEPPHRFTDDEWTRLRKLPTTSGDALMAYSEARALLNRSEAPDVDRAIALLDQATLADAQFVIAWAALGDAWWAKYQRDQEPEQATRATDALSRAISLDPNQAPVYYSLGNMQFRTGRLGEAEASFRRALQLQPDLDDAPRGLAQVLAGRGRIGEAEAILNQAIRTSRNWNNLFMLGTIEYRAGRYREAAEAFKRTTDAAPNNAGAFLMLGTVHYVLGDLQQAVGNFEHAVRLGPTAAAYANLALAYYDSGRFDDALESYEQALQRNPRNALNHRNIADVYQRLGRTREAKREYERAVALGGEILAVNPRDARTISLIAVCEARLGNRKSAERHAAEAVAVDSSSREVWQRSAEVHALLNQPEAALRDLEAAVARGFEPRMARTNDELASIRKLPRFEEILRASQGNAVKQQGAHE
jgi:tetratricopeptide (TPR) repeat protein/TolB-like protein